MNKERFNRIFDLLVTIGGAQESMRGNFIHCHVVNPIDSSEYRFQGNLGFGGKYWSRTNSVSCYPEDENHKTKKIMDRLNAELARLDA